MRRSREKNGSRTGARSDPGAEGERTSSMKKSFEKFQPFIRQNCRIIEKMLLQGELTPAALAGLFRAFVTRLVPFDESEIHCRAGCDYCCHLKVTASMAEIVVIADFLRKEGRLADCLERMTATGDDVKARAGRDEKWWAENRIPCLFLDEDDGLCTIYQVRPFSCRGYHSLDVKQCLKGYREKILLSIPCYPDLKRSREMYAVSFSRALNDLGHRAPLVELSSAIGHVLSEPDLIERWLEGEEVLSWWR
ncbi:MAG TPA: YkgJ family cysteine cluster protein [Desulfopila sp.]|nr:YkgJ family cysteine cluster protein [Desulfopila sp.]